MIYKLKASNLCLISGSLIANVKPFINIYIRATCSSILSFPSLISIIIFDQEYKLWSSGAHLFRTRHKYLQKYYLRSTRTFPAIFDT